MTTYPQTYNFGAMSTATVGTGTITLGSAIAGLLTFAQAGVQDGQEVSYAIRDGVNSETGTGIYATSSTTLTRTVTSSTASNSQISLSGSAEVYLTLRAQDALTPQATNELAMINGTLVTSTNAGALTVSLKTLAGTDPTVANPVWFIFRDATLTSGDYVPVRVTSAKTLVIDTGASMGISSASPARLWTTVHNDSGTIRLGAFTATARNSTISNSIWCPSEDVKYTTTVPGNDSQFMVTTVAIGTACPFRIIGFIEWTLLTTSGVWTAPDKIQLVSAGMRPGCSLQKQMFSTATLATVTSSAFQNTLLTKAITLASVCNLVQIDMMVSGFNNNPNATTAVMQLFRDAVGLPPVLNITAAASVTTKTYERFPFNWIDSPASTAGTTYLLKIRSIDNTTTVQFLTGVSGDTGSLVLTELMG